MLKEWDMNNWQSGQMSRKWMEKGGEEEGECDGRTALREIGRRMENNSGIFKELETYDRERSERKVRNDEEKDDGNHGYHHP